MKPIHLVDSSNIPPFLNDSYQAGLINEEKAKDKSVRQAVIPMMKSNKNSLHENISINNKKENKSKGKIKWNYILR